MNTRLFTTVSCFAFLVVRTGAFAEGAAAAPSPSLDNLGSTSPSGPFQIRELRETPDQSHARLRIQTNRRSPYPIPALMTGKFAEHLGANIYNGMDAQILRNPTFADFPFWNGQMSPDGVAEFQVEPDRIVQEIRRQGARLGWPSDEMEGLITARADGLACWWSREGEREAVPVSPDTGPTGARAQRVEVRAAGQGVGQWAYLPLHRVRQYQFEVVARSPGISKLLISLRPLGTNKPIATATIDGLDKMWRKFQGTLTLDAPAPSDVVYRLAVTAGSAGQFVLGRVLLRPTDHVRGADPDVVRLLKESHLPILRWPGGNFVSGYHWEDGVGLADQRPSRPNYAWGGVEPNLFGTDEFIAFCRAVGCEPMICLNAGSGTPAEAARWIEYCNGPASSAQGARRAANGHPEPYQVKYWEVGNELWGRWQYHWTSGAGYADRYDQFATAMRAADPTIKVYGCGAPVLWGKSWNDTLIGATARSLQAITDHPLIGGNVSPTTDPLEVYRDFMAVPEVLEKKWASLRDQMARAGIREPRLAVTELQMFAHLARPKDSSAPMRLRPENLVNPGTQAEALYDVLLYHAAVRLAPFVEMVTHSATVNHGGGLRKERERVYANPCYYAQAAFAAFAGATPVAFELNTPVERAPQVLPDLKNAPANYGSLDALAALAPAGELLISLVHRGVATPLQLEIDLQGFRAATESKVHTLTAEVPWAANTLAAPQAIKPVDATLVVRNDRLTLELQPYTVMLLRVAPGTR